MLATVAPLHDSAEPINPAPLREEDVRNVEEESGREFVNKLIVRNLLWTLAISVALTAISMVVVFIGDGYPLRVLVAMVILVPVMAAIVTFLTLQSGKRKVGRGSGNYSGHTYYPVGVPEGGAGDFDREGLFGGGDFGGGGGDSGGGW
jgi:uncharacterized membrane protein YgcG